MSAPGIVASNFRRLDRGTLLGSCDLTVPRWKLTFCGCTWHRNAGREWVNFAGREYLDRGGQRQFAVLVKFNDPDVAARFRAAALEAVHLIANHSGGRPGASPDIKGDQP